MYKWYDNMGYIRNNREIAATSATFGLPMPIPGGARRNLGATFLEQGCYKYSYKGVASV